MREPTFTNAICKAESKQISKDFAYCEDALGRAENAIGNLPSAQPEKRTEKRTETHACDCISRQMLLEYIHGEPVGRLLCDKYNLDGLIEQFPSAQPERKKGEWISNDIDPEAWNFCSVCGEQAIDLFDFCPNCGADMRGEQDE